MSTHATTWLGPIGGKIWNKLTAKPKTPAPPPPPAPLPKLEEALPGEEGARKRPRRGRSSTILTGELIPMDIGKKTLLG